MRQEQTQSVRVLNDSISCGPAISVANQGRIVTTKTPIQETTHQKTSQFCVAAAIWQSTVASLSLCHIQDRR
jgi:hypothetical protein